MTSRDPLVEFDAEVAKSSFMALGDGNHKLPVKSAIRVRIGKEAGDVVHVVITERITR